MKDNLKREPSLVFFGLLVLILSICLTSVCAADTQDFNMGQNYFSATRLIIKDASISPGSTIRTSIDLEDAINIGNMDIVLTFDPAVLRATNVIKGPLTENSMFVSNTIDGSIKIALIDPSGINGDGSIGYIEFEVIGKEGMSTPLAIIEVRANEASTREDIKVRGIGGIFTVSNSNTDDISGDGEITTVDALASLKMAVDNDASNNNGIEGGALKSEESAEILKIAVKGMRYDVELLQKMEIYDKIPTDENLLNLGYVLVDAKKYQSSVHSYSEGREVLRAGLETRLIEAMAAYYAAPSVDSFLPLANAWDDSRLMEGNPDTLRLGRDLIAEQFPGFPEIPDYSYESMPRGGSGERSLKWSFGLGVQISWGGSSGSTVRIGTGGGIESFGAHLEWTPDRGFGLGTGIMPSSSGRTIYSEQDIRNIISPGSKSPNQPESNLWLGVVTVVEDKCYPGSEGSDKTDESAKTEGSDKTDESAKTEGSDQPDESAKTEGSDKTDDDVNEGKDTTFKPDGEGGPVDFSDMPPLFRDLILKSLDVRNSEQPHGDYPDDSGSGAISTEVQIINPSDPSDPEEYHYSIRDPFREIICETMDIVDPPPP